jgi:hypothetical protein
MRKKILLLTCFFLGVVFLFLIIFFIFNNTNNLEEDNFAEKKVINLTVGYCPTMKTEALNYASDNNYLSVEYDSANNVLYALNKNEINFALIGRKAKSSEINSNIQEKVLKSGLTLINKEKKVIDLSQLKKTKVYTNLDRNTVSQNFLFDLNIVYYENKNTILQKAFSENSPILILWDDWVDDYELLVVYEGSNKVKEFRGCFLYSYR